MNILKKLTTYAHLARTNDPFGWLLLLWPTLWALWHASGGTPSTRDMLIFFGGVFLMRSFGCCVNDIADRHFDSQVARTRNRPLASDAINLAEALAVAAFFGTACLLLWLDLSAPAKLWALGALLLAMTYPLTKRGIAVPQIFLAATYSFGIPIAYAHVTGDVPHLAWLLFAANWFHVMAYDTIYAMADLTDDRRIGINSSAVFFGDNALKFVKSSYLMMLTLLLVFGYLAGLQWPFFIAYLVGYPLIFRFLMLAKSAEPCDCLHSFRINHLLGMVIWGGIALSYLVGQ